MISKKVLSIGFMGLLFVGCASFANNKRQAVSAKAAFDLSCPADQLRLSPLSSENMERATYGVTGCGKKASYVFVPGAGAVLNSPVEAGVVAATGTPNAS